MAQEWFISYTATHHHEAIEMLWLGLWGGLMLSIVIYTHVYVLFVGVYVACRHMCALLSASGSWSSMVGSRESVQKLGLIPCAISWLYSTIERRREKTWTDLTVSVSAVELCCGEEDTLRDLLGEVVPSLGSIQDSPKAHIRIQEDPIYGIQVGKLLL